MMECQSKISTYHAKEIFRAHIYGPGRDYGEMYVCRECLQGYFLEGCKIDIERIEEEKR